MMTAMVEEEDQHATSSHPQSKPADEIAGMKAVTDFAEKYRAKGSIMTFADKYRNVGSATPEVKVDSDIEEFSKKFRKEELESPDVSTAAFTSPVQTSFYGDDKSMSSGQVPLPNGVKQFAIDTPTEAREWAEAQDRTAAPQVPESWGFINQRWRRRRAAEEAEASAEEREGSREGVCVATLLCERALSVALDEPTASSTIFVSTTPKAQVEEVVSDDWEITGGDWKAAGKEEEAREESQEESEEGKGKDVICPLCDGTGMFYDDVCPLCDGTRMFYDDKGECDGYTPVTESISLIPNSKLEQQAGKIEKLIDEGRITKIQGDSLGQIWDMLIVEYVKAEDAGENLHIYIRKTPKDRQGMNSIDAIGTYTSDQIEGLVDEGGYYRIKNGITMDSGCSVFVMPSDWLAMFELMESEGSRKGQTFQAAAKGSKPIINEGQRTVKFLTKAGEKRKMTCQVAAVNKILASIGQICDGGNEVLFRMDGGDVINLKTLKRTPFRRIGNVYVMDAWIENNVETQNTEVDKSNDNGGDTNMGFTRPEPR